MKRMYQLPRVDESTSEHLKIALRDYHELKVIIIDSVVSESAKAALTTAEVRAKIIAILRSGRNPADKYVHAVKEYRELITPRPDLKTAVNYCQPLRDALVRGEQL